MGTFYKIQIIYNSYGEEGSFLGFPLLILTGSSKFSGVSPSLGWSVVRVSLKFMPSLVGAVSGV